MTERKCLVFSFADIEVREREFSIVRNGEIVAVEPKAFRVLLFLLRNPHKLIAKDELLDAVWGDTAVSENSLTRSIALLRKLLADDTHEPRYISTVPTLGYRFLCDVNVSEDGFIRSAEDHSIRSADEPKPPHTVEPDALPQSAGKHPSSSRRHASLLIGLCALALAILAAILLSRPVTEKHRTPGYLTEQRVTSNSPEAPVNSAVVSPDGKFVAYSDPTGLYLRVIASGETRRWNLPKDFIAKPNNWFPDGTHLLVTRSEGTPPTPSLWKLSLLGGDARKLIDNAGYGSPSPDGKQIAFVSDPPTGRELWVMAADGSNPHKIAEADSHGSWLFSPAWSPDGRRIAYLNRRGGLLPLATRGSIWTRDAEGSDPQEIVTDAGLGRGLAWAPDGRILFSRLNPQSERDDQDMRSIRVDEDTGKAVGPQQVVTTGTGRIGGISVTSDGKRVVLWRTNSPMQAFISEFDAHMRKWKTPRRLTLDANGNLATAWLSDSKTVLFVSNRNGTWTLFKQAIDETTADVLVDGHSLYFPRLSADGLQVLYGSNPDPANPAAPISLMRVPVAGGPPQLVLRVVGLGVYQCARLPSTLCLFARVVGNEIVFASLDPERGAGREVLRIRRPGGGNWTLSPDGRTLAAFDADAFDGSHSIRFYSLQNGAFRETNTVTLNNWFFYNGDWNANGSGVLIPSKTSSGTPVMLEVDQAGKASVVLEGAANTEFGNMIPAPDGHHAILQAWVSGDNNAWMIDTF